MSVNRKQTLAAARCVASLTQGAEQAAREWARVANERREGGRQAFAAFLRCRSPGDFLVAQADLLGAQLELTREASERLSEIVAASTGAAARALETAWPARAVA